MTRMNLHVINCSGIDDVPLTLDGQPLEKWFLDATEGLLSLKRIDVSSSRRTLESDGGLLDEILRSEIPYPENRPVHDIALIVCRHWRIPSGAGDLKIYGLMFDFKGFDPILGRFFSGGVPREACALFLDAFDGLDNDKIAFTAIHELGHVFNLGHGTTSDTFMGKTGWTARHFSANDQQELTLASGGHPPHDWNHLPGGADFLDALPARAERTVPANKLRFTARLPKQRYLLSEPITLDLLLEPKGNKSVEVPPTLDPGHPSCRIWYQTPQGERYRHRPPFYFCRATGRKTTVSKRVPLCHNPRLTVSTRGLSFTTPGPYRLWVEFDVGVQRRRPRTVRSNTVEFEIVLPRSDAEERISQILSDPIIAYFVAHKGGRLSRSKRHTLNELAKVYPRHEAVQHVRYALGHYHIKRGRRAAAKAFLHGVRLREGSLQQSLEAIRERL